MRVCVKRVMRREIEMIDDVLCKLSCWWSNMGWVCMSDLVGVDVVSFLVSFSNSLQEKRNIAITVHV